MKILIDDVELRRDEWRKMKQTTIGSSEIATICGLNPHRSILELWAEKTGKIDEFEGNEATWLGERMEPIIGELFGRRKNNEIDVIRCNAMIGHPSIPHISATPDFWITQWTEHNRGNVTEGIKSMGILETKNTSFRKLSEWEEQAPSWAQVQLQWQLGICGLEWGFVAGLVGGNVYDFKDYEFIFAPDVFSMCVDLANEFLEYVHKDIPPNAGPGDKKLVEQIVGDREKGKLTCLNVEDYPVVKEYMRVKALRTALSKQADNYKDQEDGLVARILQLMGNAETAETPWGVAFKATRIADEPPKMTNGRKGHTRLYAKGEFLELQEVHDNE